MYIIINNALPCVNFFLDLKKNSNSTIRIFVYSGAVTNMGNRTFHRWIMIQYPDIVAKYE